MSRNNTWLVFRAKDLVTDTVVRGTKRQISAFKDLKSQVDRANNSIRGISNIATLGGALSLTGAGMGAWNAIETAAEFESIANTIKFVSKSTEEATRNMSFMKGIVSDLKLEYGVTAEAFKRFLSSMEGTSFSWEQKRSMFKQVATSIRVLGLDAEKTERIFYALGEVASKGKFMAQEVTQQLGNAYPGFKKLLADAASGGDMAKLSDMMMAGEVDAEKFLPKVTQLMYDRTFKGLDVAVQKSVAKIQDFKNEWLFTMEDIGNALIDAGVVEYISEVVKGIRGWVKENKKLIGEYAKKFVDGVRKAGEWIIDNWETITTGLRLIAEAILVIKTAGLLLSAISLFNPAGAVIVGIGLITIGFMEMLRAIHNARNEIGKLETDLTGLQTQASGFGDIWSGVINLDVKSFLGGIWKLWYGIKKEILEILDSIRSIYGYFTGRKMTSLVELSGVDKQIKEVDDWINKDKIIAGSKKVKETYFAGEGGGLNSIISDYKKPMNLEEIMAEIAAKNEIKRKEEIEKYIALANISQTLNVYDNTSNGVMVNVATKPAFGTIGPVKLNQ